MRKKDTQRIGNTRLVLNACTASHRPDVDDVAQQRMLDDLTSYLPAAAAAAVDVSMATAVNKTRECHLRDIITSTINDDIQTTRV